MQVFLSGPRSVAKQGAAKNEATKAKQLLNRSKLVQALTEVGVEATLVPAGGGRLGLCRGRMQRCIRSDVT